MFGLTAAVKNNSSIKSLDKIIINIYNNLKILSQFNDNEVEIIQTGFENNSNNSFTDNYINIYIDGQCYNINEICSIYNINCKSFPELILYGYKNNLLDKILNKIDGVFHAVIYDQLNKKILVISDRWGLRPIYIYSKNDDFACGSDIKNLLQIDYTDSTPDKNSFNTFMEFEYILGNNTWFKYIKRLAPATILEFDIQSKKQIQRYYWTFAEISKRNISFDDAVDMAYQLFNKAMEKMVTSSEKYALLLSAGFDSRLIFASFIENFPDKIPYVYTFGVENCRDFITAEKICKIAGIKHNKYYFENTNWLSKRYNLLYDIDCACSIKHLHGIEFMQDIIKHAQISISGFLGDTIFGDGYLAKIPHTMYDKRSNKDLAESIYGDYAKYSMYDDEYFNIDNPLPLLWFNRGKNFINMPALVSINIEVLRPFFSNEIVEFIASIPNKYLENSKLYRYLVLKYYPKYFKTIPRNNENATYKTKDLIYRINKINHKLEDFYRKLTNRKVIKSYADYEKWICEEPTQNKIRNLLKYSDSYYSMFTAIDYEKTVLEPHLQGKVNNTDKILCIASVEIYFRYINNLLNKSSSNMFR